MATLILDEELAHELQAERAERGIDGRDEVWDGVYVVTPIANDEHQDLVGWFTMALLHGISIPGKGLVRPGVNVSDRRKNWKQNFRCPDVVVFL